MKLITKLLVKLFDLLKRLKHVRWPISLNIVFLKFGDGPNLCRVKKVDVSSTFIEVLNWLEKKQYSFFFLHYLANYLFLNCLRKR